MPVDRAGYRSASWTFGAVGPSWRMARERPQRGSTKRCFQPTWAAASSDSRYRRLHPPMTLLPEATTQKAPPRRGTTGTWARCGEGEPDGSITTQLSQRGQPPSSNAAAVCCDCHSPENLPEWRPARSCAGRSAGELARKPPPARRFQRSRSRSPAHSCRMAVPAETDVHAFAGPRPNSRARSLGRGNPALGTLTPVQPQWPSHGGLKEGVRSILEFRFDGAKWDIGSAWKNEGKEQT